MRFDKGQRDKYEPPKPKRNRNPSGGRPIDVSKIDFQDRSASDYLPNPHDVEREDNNDNLSS